MKNRIVAILLLLVFVLSGLPVFATGGSSRGGGFERNLLYYTEFTPGGGNAVYNIGAGRYTKLIDKENNQINLPRNGTVQTINTTNITYNTTNNTYNVTDIENNYYTFVDNSTYISVTYLQSGNSVTDEFYYQLPDGRNSFDLTAEDIKGTVFIYDFVNYPQVIEDENTLLLYHFDGDLLNSSGFSSSASFSLGGSISYVGAPSGFGSSLYLDGLSHQIDFSPPPEYLVGQDYTVEFRFYCSQAFVDGSRWGGLFNVDNEWILNWYRWSSLRPDTLRFLLSPQSDWSQNVSVPVPIGTWNAFAIVRINGVTSYFLNGLKIFESSLFSGAGATSFSFGKSSLLGFSLQLDEFRVTNKALYSGNSYSPSSQPFDTNKVLVLPESGTENAFAVKSSVPVNGTRIGGVRPSMPTKGFVYCSLDANKIKTVQQYDGANWVSLDGAIYTGGAWVAAVGYDLSPLSGGGDITAGGTDPDSPGGGADPSNPDEGGGILAGIGKIFSFIVGLFGSLVDGLASIFVSIGKLFTSLTGFGGDFVGFLGSALGIVPPEIVALLTLGVALMIALAVIKAIRG